MQIVFFFNDPATTEIYTLSLHAALPICHRLLDAPGEVRVEGVGLGSPAGAGVRLRVELDDLPPAPQGVDRKSTRLNSSHANISYAVFCLKKKKKRDKEVCRSHLLYLLFF